MDKGFKMVFWLLFVGAIFSLIVLLYLFFIADRSEDEESEDILVEQAQVLDVKNSIDYNCIVYKEEGKDPHELCFSVGVKYASIIAEPGDTISINIVGKFVLNGSGVFNNKNILNFSNITHTTLKR